MITWDVNEIFRIAGGTDSIISFCAAHSAGRRTSTPSRNTVRIWKHRQNIAAAWLPAVVWELMSQGYPLSHLTKGFPAVKRAAAPSGDTEI